ncbi:MAG: cadherin-like domain-containing protein [Actinomycetota bacterium]|nr:cadherin-like domain-containing protein [Acidimicrobiia bacterium]MDQ3468543.1 cadherin-like domain-containing protein [Actinomycetota bacterium]
MSGRRPEARPQDTKLTPPFATGDLDGDALEFAIVSGAANGDVQLQGVDTFVYAPGPGFTGQDSFVYSVTDGVVTSEAAVTIEVQPDVIIDGTRCASRTAQSRFRSAWRRRRRSPLSPT